MFEVIEDTLIDGVKLVPFLFITYLFMAELLRFIIMIKT